MPTSFCSPLLRTRFFWPLMAVIGLSGITLIFYLTRIFLAQDIPYLLDSGSILNDLGLFLFINFNISVVVFFAYLVVKNLVRLWIDRRRQVMGARLRSRLVAAFITLTIIPTTLLYFIAQGLLSTVQEGWLSPQVSLAVTGARSIALSYYNSLEENLKTYANQLAKSPILTENCLEPTSEICLSFLVEKMDEFELQDMSIIDELGKLQTTTYQGIHPENATSSFSTPLLPTLQRALAGEVIVRPEQQGSQEVLRSYNLISPEPTIADDAGNKLSRSSNTRSLLLVLSYPIPNEVSKTLSEVLDAHADYQELLTYHRPLASTYLLTLLVVTVVIAFAAIWVGFYLARGLVIPIQLLADGTQQIARGNLDHRIPDVGDDELAILVQSFNLMTHDLRKTTAELVARRRYMETVLDNVAVGVVSIDNDERIETFNTAAATILSSPVPPRNCRLRQVLPGELYNLLKEAIRQVSEQGLESVSQTQTVIIQGEAKYLDLNVSHLRSSETSVLGHVILIDDLSELVKAQRMAAWRDVARRIAHEIKNPLTPIQLSAQRIERRLAKVKQEIRDSLPDTERQVVLQGTNIILTQVKVMRKLVDEFSHFARMPRANLQKVQLNEIVKETLSMYRSLHPNIRFIPELDLSLEPLELDRVLLGQVLVNLIENSLSALSQRDSDSHMDVEQDVPPNATVEHTSPRHSTERGEIRFRTSQNKDLRIAILQVLDNGPGISDHDKDHLFEPYFSTKKEGTGLGLTIVSSIIQDHGGHIRVSDAEPHGACFTIELPCRG